MYIGYAVIRGIIRDEEGGQWGGGKDSSDNFLSISTKAGLYNFIMSFILKIFKWDDDREVSLLPQKRSENEHFLHRKQEVKWL